MLGYTRIATFASHCDGSCCRWTTKLRLPTSDQPRKLVHADHYSIRISYSNVTDQLPSVAMDPQLQDYRALQQARFEACDLLLHEGRSYGWNNVEAKPEFRIQFLFAVVASLGSPHRDCPRVKI